jgi:hypothetical protein
MIPSFGKSSKIKVAVGSKVRQQSLRRAVRYQEHASINAGTRPCTVSEPRCRRPQFTVIGKAHFRFRRNTTDKRPKGLFIQEATPMERYGSRRSSTAEIRACGPFSSEEVRALLGDAPDLRLLGCSERIFQKSLEHRAKKLSDAQWIEMAKARLEKAMAKAK